MPYEIMNTGFVTLLFTESMNFTETAVMVMQEFTTASESITRTIVLFNVLTFGDGIE
jgi:hypothetical protein